MPTALPSGVTVSLLTAMSLSPLVLALALALSLSLLRLSSSWANVSWLSMRA